MQRRTLLGVGLVGGAALALAGGSALWLREPAWRDGRLLSDGRAVMAAVARAVLEGSLPDMAPAASAAIDAHLARLQTAVAAMPLHVQREVAELLGLLAFGPGRIALARLRSPWGEASVPQIQAALQSMRASRFLLRRQAYAALRDLTHAAYFADASTWERLGYPGPAALTPA